MTDSFALGTSSPPPVPVTAQRHMFTADSRKALLREVVRLEPYKNPSMWDAVTHRYSWWCYKNISPPRRSVPKDRLRKKVKSIIAKFPSASVPSSGANDLKQTESSSPEHTALVASSTPKSAAVDDDNMPYDSETLGLIEEVVKQYTESMELIQARRVDRSRKRESDMGIPHSPGSSKSPPAALRFRAPMTPGSEMLHSDASYSTPLGITDMISQQRKRSHDEDEALLNNGIKYRKTYPNSEERKNSKFMDDMLLTEFDSLKNDIGSNSQVAFFADSVASAASTAIVGKLPQLLDAVRGVSEETSKAQIESLGNSLGAAFASSFSSTFEATINKAMAQIFKRLDETAAARDFGSISKSGPSSPSKADSH